MSQSVKVNLAIRNIPALYRAVGILQSKGIACSLVENAMPRNWYENQLAREGYSATGRAPYVLQLPGCHYDVSFLPQPDGSFNPYYDHMDIAPFNRPEVEGVSGGVASVLGTTGEDGQTNALGLFSAAYGAAVAATELEAMGLLPQYEFQPNGNIVVVADAN